jgi:hypothetical protein
MCKHVHRLIAAGIHPVQTTGSVIANNVILRGAAHVVDASFIEGAAVAIAGYVLAYAGAVAADLIGGTSAIAAAMTAIVQAAFFISTAGGAAFVGGLVALLVAAATAVARSIDVAAFICAAAVGLLTAIVLEGFLIPSFLLKRVVLQSSFGSAICPAVWLAASLVVPHQQAAARGEREEQPQNSRENEWFHGAKYIGYGWGWQDWSGPKSVYP